MILKRLREAWLATEAFDPVWPMGLAFVVALVLLLCLPACAGPRVEAVERERAETVAEADQVRAELATEEPGTDRWNELMDELEALRVRLVQLEAERAKGLADDTRDVLWELGELLLVGGGVGLGVNRHRSKTRAELEERVCQLERAQDGGS